ncbi:alkaline phosphatase D family protein [Bradyrhizobium sp. LHD-71]|uniref:alkaline phosphatase D family protein n=1 Tax=Bradyrhizobium sp. LHD-71 TaxID=3072141 RepID=UPI00280E23C7|nr:alkaline phosphatase D family protein [Bradyrhizobium sp. LHD-71]MDQ8726536.1 alkaline phosphatase D family protein [Bradyrhizobium sp. LHD-71]
MARTPLTRRRFLARGVSSLAVAVLGNVASPRLSLAASRPVLTHGLQSGDVMADSGVVWARTDRPSRLLIEASTTESFKSLCCTTVADALPESDLTAKVLLDELPAGQQIFYRVTPYDLASPATRGEVQTGRFRTAPNDKRSVSFVWSGDTAGQGWGIDEARGGMRTFRTMLDNRPDFFVHSGDSIYADCPIERELKLPDGGTWCNVVTEEKAEVAQSLAQFRGNYKYNLMDANVRGFNAEVPIFAQWDDHEVANDWWPSRTIDEAGYVDRSAMQLAARAGRAFHEYMPTRQTLLEPGRVYRKIGYGPLLDVFLIDMRSYRGPNDEEVREAPLLGAKQTAWLKRELALSKATWKVIAADMPIGLVSSDAVARGDGPPAGRETEIAGLLAFIKRAGVKNIVWLTADMHYTAAHHYDPNRAIFQDFEPFWEFVSGPLHAGTWGPAPLDNTFGPQVLFQKGCTAEQGENLAPCFGLQFFGHVDIEGTTGVMTVTLKDVGDQDLWSVRIEPAVEPRTVIKFA